jgi:hypothetical protein
MTAQTPWLLWVLLTIGSVVVGAAMLVVALVVFNRRQGGRHGFEVKTGTGADAAAAAPGEKEHHG